ncbi:hypothetical protein RJ639_045013 [Escallonia herrerae]|uniref:Uncharacterized protein n=1 Tax=Escallonia herrerae TaxID=1293975 RepID=A0AA88WAN6_9ASTE|nr:hypothetical protein RJ639_045013 [Escallonia herrerae]
MEIDFPPYQLSSQLRGHEDDVRGICVCDNVGIATSSRDRTIRFWTLDQTNNRDYTMSKILLGHTSFVGPLAWVLPNEQFPEGAIVSGGMDTNVLVTNLGTGENVRTLKDALEAQPFSKWLLLHTRIANLSLRDSLVSIAGACGNIKLSYWPMGSSIRLWALTGQTLMEMVGHTSIVYSVDAHTSGFIVSGSEDRFAKIWKDGVCVQSIEHPGCVWDAKFLENGDIVTACSDGVVRIWTIRQDKIADSLALESYASLLSQYKCSRKSIGGLKLEELPGLEALQIPGTSDGQTKVVREGDNGVAYAWNMIEHNWDKIGEVVDGPEDSMKRPVLGGTQYDYASAYVPGEPSNKPAVSIKPSFKHVPKKGMLVFDVAQFDGILKKISEFNNTLLTDQEKSNLSLTEVDISRLVAIAKILKDTSHYHSSKFSDVDIALLVKLLTLWPLEMIFPVIDLLRMIVLHPDGATILLNHVYERNDILMELIQKATASPLPANILTSIRAVTNLFRNLSYYPWLQKHRGEILDAFSSFYSSSNKNVQVAYSTLILNYAVLLIEKKDQEGQSQVLSAALEIAEEENLEVDSKFRAMVAIGSLMLEGLVKRIALDFDVENIAKVAKASKDTKIAEIGLDMDSGVGESADPSCSGDTNCNTGFFECNICFELAQDPIVTLCGHLYCWPCLYRWLHNHSYSHECPVCKALIQEEKLVPIYGRGKSSSDLGSRSVIPALDIPNRPVGQRPETAPTPEINYFRQEEVGQLGGFMQITPTRFGSSTLSALLSCVPSYLNLQVHGFHDATVYGATTGVPYPFFSSLHGGYAHVLEEPVSEGPLNCVYEMGIDCSPCFLVVPASKDYQSMLHFGPIANEI